MTDKKISELTAIDSVVGTDLLPIVDDSASATKKATAAQVKDYIIGLANTWTANQTLGSSVELLWSTDLRLTRRGAANLRLGAADAAGSSITVSSVDTSAETVTLLSAHGLSSGAAVQFTTTTTLPGGITAGTTYYVRVTSTTAFELYTTYDGAVAASGTTGRINITSAGTGTHTCNFALPFQKLSLQSFTGTDIPGQPFVITGSQGTGTGRGGDIIFQVAPAGTTGSSQNALATALTINSDRTTSFSGNISITGTITSTGNIVGNQGNFLNQVQAGTTVGLSFGLNLGNAQSIAWNSGVNWYSSTFDLTLFRDAANTLALRNGANAQEQRVYGSYTSATNFQRMSIKTLRESSGALSGASYTTTIAIPAYAVPVGVTTRVTTAITGATSYDVGDGTDVDLWGDNIGITLGSQSRTADFTAIAAVDAAATARTVTLTAVGSNFTGGVVEICVHYLTTEAD